MLQRKTPIERRTRLRSRSPRRAPAALAYRKASLEYLALHPWCQIWIARLGLDEDAVIAQRGLVVLRNAAGVRYTECAPRSTEVHHRNKKHGLRLVDQRWWMAASRPAHDWVESNKTEARSLGFLLPIQANEDGEWGAGQRALPTPEFMKARARQ